MEVSRTVWGSSTRVLENERVRAVRDVYSFDYQTCYDAIVDLSEDASIGMAVYRIFQERPDEGMFVVMKVPGSVDTTEVGIFLTSIKKMETAVEVASLSQFAKRYVADAIRDRMAQKGIE
jgi:hypothetical protein